MEELFIRSFNKDFNINKENIHFIGIEKYQDLEVPIFIIYDDNWDRCCSLFLTTIEINDNVVNFPIMFHHNVYNSISNNARKFCIYHEIGHIISNRIYSMYNFYILEERNIDNELISDLFALLNTSCTISDIQEYRDFFDYDIKDDELQIRINRLKEIDNFYHEYQNLLYKVISNNIKE